MLSNRCERPAHSSICTTNLQVKPKAHNPTQYIRTTAAFCTPCPKHSYVLCSFVRWDRSLANSLSCHSCSSPLPNRSFCSGQTALVGLTGANRTSGPLVPALWKQSARVMGCSWRNLRIAATDKYNHAALFPRTLHTAAQSRSKKNREPGTFPF